MNTTLFPSQGYTHLTTIAITVVLSNWKKTQIIWSPVVEQKNDPPSNKKQTQVRVNKRKKLHLSFGLVNPYVDILHITHRHIAHCILHVFTHG